MEKLTELWRDYFSEDCAVISTEKERELSAKLSSARKRLCEILTKEQEFAVEGYIEAFHGLSSSLAEKAFIQGCKFTASFLLDTLDFKQSIT